MQAQPLTVDKLESIFPNQNKEETTEASVEAEEEEVASEEVEVAEVDLEEDAEASIMRIKLEEVALFLDLKVKEKNYD